MELDLGVLAVAMHDDPVLVQQRDAIEFPFGRVFLDHPDDHIGHPGDGKDQIQPPTHEHNAQRTEEQDQVE